MNTAKRDGRIEILRFVFCLLILMTHTTLIGYDETRPFAGAYVFVEFYFFTSGYYLCRRFMGSDSQAANSSDQNGLLPIRYTLSKWKGFLLYSGLNVLLLNGLLWYTESWSMRTGLSMLVNEIPEVLLLSMAGLEQRFVIWPLWYVSSYLLVLPLFIYLILNHKKLFSAGGLLFALLYYGYTFRRWGGIDQWHNDLGFGYDGLIRALAGLTVGGLIYLISVELQKLTFTKRGKAVITGIECGAFAAILCVSCFLQRDYLVIGLLAVMLSIMLSKQSYTARFKADTWTSFLGKISVPLYFSHWFVGIAIMRLLPDAAGWLRLCLYLSVSLVLAVMLYVLKNRVDQWSIRQRWMIEKTTDDER